MPRIEGGSIMMRLALATALVALATMSAVESASAGQEQFCIFTSPTGGRVWVGFC
jgi:hypothetical protein